MRLEYTLDPADGRAKQKSGRRVSLAFVRSSSGGWSLELDLKPRKVRAALGQCVGATGTARGGPDTCATTTGRLSSGLAAQVLLRVKTPAWLFGKNVESGMLTLKLGDATCPALGVRRGTVQVRKVCVGCLPAA